MKACKSCGDLKPLDEFSPDGRTSDGHQARCKPCRASAAKAGRVPRSKPEPKPAPKPEPKPKPAPKPKPKPEPAPKPAPKPKRAARLDIGPALPDILADIEDVDPSLRRRVAGQIAVLDRYDQLDPEKQDQPQQARVRLDACTKITDILEKRRSEEMAKARKSELADEILDLMRTPVERAEARAGR